MDDLAHFRSSGFFLIYFAPFELLQTLLDCLAQDFWMPALSSAWWSLTHARQMKKVWFLKESYGHPLLLTCHWCWWTLHCGCVGLSPLRCLAWWMFYPCLLGHKQKSCNSDHLRKRGIANFHYMLRMPHFVYYECQVLSQRCNSWLVPLILALT